MSLKILFYVFSTKHLSSIFPLQREERARTVILKHLGSEINLNLWVNWQDGGTVSCNGLQRDSSILLWTLGHTHGEVSLTHSENVITDLTDSITNICRERGSVSHSKVPYNPHVEDLTSCKECSTGINGRYGRQFLVMGHIPYQFKKYTSGFSYCSQELYMAKHFPVEKTTTILAGHQHSLWFRFCFIAYSPRAAILVFTPGIKGGHTLDRKHNGEPHHD